MATERIPMTREGYEKKKAELDRMQNLEMIEVAKRIKSGTANRGVAHASSGPCLQQNLVCVLEGSN